VFDELFTYNSILLKPQDSAKVNDYTSASPESSLELVVIWTPALTLNNGKRVVVAMWSLHEPGNLRVRFPTPAPPGNLRPKKINNKYTFPNCGFNEEICKAYFKKLARIPPRCGRVVNASGWESEGLEFWTPAAQGNLLTGLPKKSNKNILSLIVCL